MGRKIQLVDDQKIGLQDARPTFAWNIVALPHINHEHPPIDQVKREGRGKVIPAAFDEDQIEIRE